jgi:citrate synthase
MILPMAAADAKPRGGLEDVVATSSAICYIDGDRGVLAYCGYDIHDLASKATFEEVCYLLWHRRLPTRAELGDLQTQLAAARVLPEPIVRLLRSLPRANGMDLLRTATSALAPVLARPCGSPASSRAWWPRWDGWTPAAA